MKKITILAVILALAVALTACGSGNTPETTAPVTTAATVPAETSAPQPLTLTDWSMSASTWSSPNGATIHITAVPGYYEEGQKADFVVRLESDEITSVPCQWDGTSYTASADLNAANGYCYYVVLTAADGTSAEVAVNTPVAPVNEAFINMESSLESYCSITIEESECTDGKLTLFSGSVQVQAPVITNNGETITCQEAILVLSFDGSALQEEILSLAQTDTAGLFEANLENVVFEIPERSPVQRPAALRLRRKLVFQR